MHAEEMKKKMKKFPRILKESIIESDLDPEMSEEALIEYVDWLLYIIETKKGSFITNDADGYTDEEFAELVKFFDELIEKHANE